jgi:ribose 1,5-bisphosphokinase PhnN
MIRGRLGVPRLTLAKASLDLPELISSQEILTAKFAKKGREAREEIQADADLFSE